VDVLIVFLLLFERMVFMRTINAGRRSRFARDSTYIKVGLDLTDQEED